MLQSYNLLTMPGLSNVYYQGTYTVPTAEVIESCLRTQEAISYLTSVPQSSISEPFSHVTHRGTLPVFSVLWTTQLGFGKGWMDFPGAIHTMIIATLNSLLFLV